MADIVVEKSAEVLRREIDELNRQQREITERLRDPRGLRKKTGAGARGINAGATAGPQRLLGRSLSQRRPLKRADAGDVEDQPPTKKRLLSAVVKVEGDEDGSGQEKPESNEPEEEDQNTGEDEEEKRKPLFQHGHGSGHRGFRGGDRGFAGQENEPIEPLPRVIPKIDDPNVAKRNRRMFGALLGTLEKFRQEDKKLSGSEAFMRRSTSLQRAEQRAQESSERLRQQEREQVARKRKRDLILRARLVAKADEKQLEVLFIQWTEHQAKLCSFLRTKAEPAIFYIPVKPSEETDKLLEAQKEKLAEWKAQRRAELSDYQKQCTEEHLAKVELEIERWQAGFNQGNNNDIPSTTAEEMDSADLEGDGQTVQGNHGWRRGRLSIVSENTEEDQNEEIAEDHNEEMAEGECKTETEVGTTAKLEVESKGIGGQKLEMKDRGFGEILKDVMDYGSGEE